MLSFFHEENWKKVIEEGKALLEDFPEANLSLEALYYLGVSFFFEKDFDLANRYFSDYLEEAANPSFFEKTLNYKYLIAEEFRKGAKKHLVKWEKSPKWLSAEEEALQIYEEIIHTYPYEELGAKALYGKAKLQRKRKEYSQSLDSLQTLLIRFPRHELAIESFIETANIYVERAEQETLDPDWLELAHINYRKFQEAFPGEKRLQEVRSSIREVEEKFAEGLYEIGSFYERTKKPEAALIYYEKIVHKFPHTHMAKKVQKCMEKLQKKTS